MIIRCAMHTEHRQCKLAKKSCGELIAHFVEDLDNMCRMSDTHIKLCIIDIANKKNHNGILQDFRILITHIIIGTVAGTADSCVTLEGGQVAQGVVG